MNLMG